MSDSDSSTIPITPSPLSEDILNQEIDNVFAWLRPINTIACEAFDDAVNAVIKHPTTYLHMRQFFHTSQNRSVRAASVFTDDSTSADNGECDQSNPQWTGAFKFSLKTVSCATGDGWSLGTGHGLPSGEEVDIMIAPPSRRWLKSIAGKHARFYFHKESARMALEARHTIKLSGMDKVDVITKTAVRVLEKGQFISIGDCLYTFEYTDLMKSKDFLDDLSKWMKVHHGPGWALHRTLSSTLGGDHINLGNYTCTPGAFAQGTFGEVTAGWARDGSTVAIKRFKKPKEESLKAHREMTRYIGEHDNILTLLECISNFTLTHPGAFCVYKPLAMGSLLDVIGLYTSDIYAQSTLLVDYLKGLTFLHDEKGVMHRDVNPNNLGVVSFDPPRGVLLDLDSATREEESLDHMQGTLPYLAPEIIELKVVERRSAGASTASGAWPGRVPYRQGVDVWAMGLSVYALYVGQSFNWIPYKHRDANRRADQPMNVVDRESYKSFMSHLQTKRASAGDELANALLGLVENMTHGIQKLECLRTWP